MMKSRNRTTATAHKKAIRCLLMILIVIVNNVAVAQDPLFSQFWYSPVYLNPAFTGCGKNEFRACFNSRVQWVNLQSPLQSYTGSVDYLFQKYQASVGVLANRFNEGYLRTTQAHLLMAKSIGSDTYNDDCRTWFVNVAFQGGFSWYNANKDRLLFPDQIDENGVTGQQSQFEGFKNAGKPRFDMSVGMLFCFKNVMAGAAWQHILETPYGLPGGSEESRLPRRYTFHLSYVNLHAEDEENDYKLIVKPTVIYNVQGISNSLMAGSLFEVPAWPVSIGFWYKSNFGRGSNLGITENRTFCLNINLKFGPGKSPYNGETLTRFNAGLSYEAELNRPGIRYTYGSAEGGLLYEENVDQSAACPHNGCEVRYPWMYF